MRFLPHTPKQREEMLAAIGVASMDDLYDRVPKESELKAPIDLPNHTGERDVELHMTALANQNRHAGKGPFFLGAGCYYHHIPATVDHVIQRSEFLTSYTPYQPEISQGTLAVVFEFQSMIAALTGQEIANASMYDGATAVTEAALMARRITKRDEVCVFGALHPHYRETLDTYMETLDGQISEGMPTEKSACVIVQTPDFFGNIHALEALRKACDETGALLVVAVTEIVSLGLLPAPSCADIVVGEGQSIGVGMQFGGPHVGFFACKKKDVRQMPGRLCGATTDADGKPSYVLTLNTREQHIRREKATSNICTNVGLMATAFTVHLSLLGEIGFKHLAQKNHEKAVRMADKLEAVEGVKVINDTFFNEFTIELPKDAFTVAKALEERNVIGGLPLEGNKMLVAVTEMVVDKDMEAYVNALKEVL